MKDSYRVLAPLSNLKALGFLDNAHPLEQSSAHLAMAKGISLTKTAVQATLTELRHLMKHGISCGLLPEGPVRAIFFDMDATLIEEETLEVMARYAGKEPEIAAITHRAMNGELDFEAALEARLQALKGLTEKDLADAAASLTLSDGMAEFAKAASSQGIKLYLVSGGFTLFAVPLARRLGFSGVFAHDLVIKNGAMTGELHGSVIDAEAKAAFVQRICKAENIPLETTAVVGDGFNDRLMMTNSPRAIGFRPKPALISHINVANFTGSHALLRNLLFP